MGILDGLEKLGKAAIGAALTPVDVVRDVVPGAGGMVDGEDSKTLERLDKVKRNLEEGVDEIDE
jgi:hypothetical protein